MPSGDGTGLQLANALGFHAPIEALRVLGTSIQKGEQARRELAALFVKQGWKYPVELPDISTKEKAQKFIGLDMPKLTKAKEEFLTTTTVKWDEEARKRQGYLFDYKTKDEYSAMIVIFRSPEIYIPISGK